MDFVKQTISPSSPPRGVEHRPGSTTNLFKATFFGGWFLGGQLQDSYNLNFLWHQTEMSTKLSMYNKKRVHTKVILTEQSLTKRFVGITSWVLQEKWYLGIPEWNRRFCTSRPPTWLPSGQNFQGSMPISGTAPTFSGAEIARGPGLMGCVLARPPLRCDSALESSFLPSSSVLQVLWMVFDGLTLHFDHFGRAQKKWSSWALKKSPLSHPFFGWWVSEIYS